MMKRRDLDLAKSKLNRCKEELEEQKLNNRFLKNKGLSRESMRQYLDLFCCETFLKECLDKHEKCWKGSISRLCLSFSQIGRGIVALLPQSY